MIQIKILSRYYVKIYFIVEFVIIALFLIENYYRVKKKEQGNIFVWKNIVYFHLAYTFKKNFFC